MPECDGFDVVELLGADLPETVIFVTAYATYALRAFEAGALDYIVKPLDDARFSRALERAKGRLARGTPYHAHSLRRIAVKNRGQTLFLKASEIDCAYSSDRERVFRAIVNSRVSRLLELVFYVKCSRSVKIPAS